MAHFISRRLVKAVGYLDGLISTAFFIKIIYCDMSPLIQQDVDVNKRKYLIWPAIGLCILFGAISILAAITLVLSTRPNVGSKKAVQMIRFWMQCNNFAIMATPFECIGFAMIFPSRWISVVIPALLYLTFRIVFVFIIGKELEAVSPRRTYRPTPEPNLNERPVRRCPSPIPGFSGHCVRSPPGGVRPFHLGRQLQLVPYRGRGPPHPNFKCFAQQMTA